MGDLATDPGRERGTGRARQPETRSAEGFAGGSGAEPGASGQRVGVGRISWRPARRLWVRVQGFSALTRSSETPK